MTTQAFGHNFIPLLIAALRGTRSQMIFRSIPKGELSPRLQLTKYLSADEAD